MRIRDAVVGDVEAITEILNYEVIHLKEVGYKFNQWVDTHYFTKRL